MNLNVLASAVAETCRVSKNVRMQPHQKAHNLLLLATNNKGNIACGFRDMVVYKPKNSSFEFHMFSQRLLMG